MISIITPSYNRAQTLFRVRDSILIQTSQEFEWIIVDDGSTDETETIVATYLKELPNKLRYFKKQNGGKHSAVNFGVKKAKGKFILIADSDDSFAANTVQRFLEVWDGIPVESRDQFCGVRVCVEDQFGVQVSNELSVSPTDETNQNMHYRFGFVNESWCMMRKDLHLQFPYPEIENAYVAESIIWNQISGPYKIRYVNDILRIYYREVEENSIMTGKKRLTYKINTRLAKASFMLNEEFDYFRFAPMEFIRQAIVYNSFSLFGIKQNKQHFKLNFSAKVFTVLFFIPSIIAHLFIRLKKDYIQD